MAESDRRVDPSVADRVETPPVEDAPAPADTRREYRGTGIIWGAVGLLLVVAALVVVVIQNSQNVEFDFLWFNTEMPLSVIVAVAVAVSLLVGEVVGFLWRRRRRSRLQEREELKRLRRRTR
jgi:uncharacterized integral membrane protein